MGWFGMSESELKKFAEDLAKQDTDLKNRAVDLESQGRVLAQGIAALQRERAAFEVEKKNFNASSAATLTQIAEKKANILEQSKAWMQNERTAFEAEKKSFAENSAKTLDAIAQEQAKLEARRQELLKMEAEAKNGFVQAQTDAFREVIEIRLKDLDEQKKVVEAIIADAEERLRKATEAQEQIVQREVAVSKREQKAEEALESKAKKQYDANVAEAARLKDKEDQLANKRCELKAYEEVLRQRESAIRDAEQNRDAGYAEERAALDVELTSKREAAAAEIAELHSQCNQAIAEKQKTAQGKYAQAIEEMGAYRESRLKEIEAEIAQIRDQRLLAVTDAENVERERIQLEINSARRASEQEKTEVEKLLQTQREELAKQKAVLLALETELAGQKQLLEQDAVRLEKQEERSQRQWEHRNETIDDEIAVKIQDIKTTLESQLNDCRKENQRLLEQIHHQSELIGAFDILKQQLGDQDPSEIIRNLASKSDELIRLREELAQRPTEEMRERYEKQASEIHALTEKNEALQQQIKNDSAAVAEADNLRLQNSEFAAQNHSLQQQVKLFEGQANQAMAELERLRAAYERPAEVEARYKEIELPYLTADKISPPEKSEDPANVNELEWLNGISEACDNYGLHFNPRIVKAFHTALKTAEWSPLTVLAGVSGTGKSELPRLYSHFGGLFFEPLSVQPNWDSQESMLGFFNSIDNKFDAQPVLRFLAQSQKAWTDDYPGLKDAVCMVLLDEMNLAHPELYFAEFLSKLELRRGMKKTDLPSLPVKIGAGLKPYDLKLGRNILWTGTMNQDETTKSLSDKVLDRSIIIYFPRPTELKRRQKLKLLDQQNRGKILHWATWGSWLMAGSSFSDTEVQPYKKFIEEMNNSLGVVGRAIGHRVWQSVEYYMANYPDVRAAKANGDKNALEQAMHIAFEDQLVQKVMPKLRGIDTEGDSLRFCLDKIQGQLQEGVNGQGFNLVSDFELAKKLGYGQFMWQSANYLKEADATNE